MTHFFQCIYLFNK